MAGGDAAARSRAPRVVRRARAARAVHRALRAGARGRRRPPHDRTRRRRRSPGRRWATSSRWHRRAPITRRIAGRRLRAAARMHRGNAPSTRVIVRLAFGVAWPGRRRLPHGPQVEDRAREPAPPSWPSTSTRASPARSRTATTSSAIRTGFLEGMLIAAWAVGIEARLRLPARRVSRRAARCSRASSTLRADPPCPLPAIHLRRGAWRVHLRRRVRDDRVDRGQARHAALRPPYVAQVGLFGRPTLEHNMETLFWVRDIRRRAPRGSRDRAATAARACARSRSRDA